MRAVRCRVCPARTLARQVLIPGAAAALGTGRFPHAASPSLPRGGAVLRVRSEALASLKSQPRASVPVVARKRPVFPQLRGVLEHGHAAPALLDESLMLGVRGPRTGCGSAREPPGPAWGPLPRRRSAVSLLQSSARSKAACHVHAPPGGRKGGRHEPRAALPRLCPTGQNGAARSGLGAEKLGHVPPTTHGRGGGCETGRLSRRGVEMACGFLRVKRPRACISGYRPEHVCGMDV